MRTPTSSIRNSPDRNPTIAVGCGSIERLANYRPQRRRLGKNETTRFQHTLPSPAPLYTVCLHLTQGKEIGLVVFGGNVTYGPLFGREVVSERAMYNLHLLIF
jgi:hypothetical protein